VPAIRALRWLVEVVIGAWILVSCLPVLAPAPLPATTDAGAAVDGQAVKVSRDFVRKIAAKIVPTLVRLGEETSISVEVRKLPDRPPTREGLGGKRALSGTETIRNGSRPP
jgi:hypothetical protein